MSRQGTKTSNLVFIPNGITNDGSYYFQTRTNVENAYTDSSSTSYAQLTLQSSRNSTRNNQIYLEFDKSELSNIPSNATISSVSCYVRYAVSSTSYVSALSIQLYSNTSAKGTAITNRSTTNSTSGGTRYSVSAGSWTLSELQNIRLHISATHSASTTTAYLYLYGADITINYTINGIEYEVSFSNNTSVTTSPNSSTFIWEGENQEITFSNVTDLASLSVTDNSNNITSDLEYVSGNTYKYIIENISEDHTFTLRTVSVFNITVTNNSTQVTTTPGAGTHRTGQGSNFPIKLEGNTNNINLYDNDVKSNNFTEEPVYNIGEDEEIFAISEYDSDNSNLYNGSTTGNAGNSNSTNYDSLRGRNQGGYYAFYNFDFSNLPNILNILSITLKVKGCRYSTYTWDAILCKGTTETDNIINITASSTSSSAPNDGEAQVFTLNITNIDINDLETLKLKLKQGTGSNNTRLYFYGADITIEYEYQEFIGYDTFYTVENVQAAHIIRIEDKPQYNITTSVQTFQAQTNPSISPSSITIFEGESKRFDITADIGYGVLIKDNNVDVTQNAFLQEYGHDTLTFNPVELTNSNGTVTNSQNALNGTLNDTYAQLRLQSGTYMEYSFDVSSIPNNATIVSISCSIKGCVTRTSAAATAQLYHESTAKGTSVDLAYNSDVTITSLSVGTWTREELNDIRIRISSIYTSSSEYYAQLYGVDLIIEYEVDGYLYYIISNIQESHNIVLYERSFHSITTSTVNSSIGTLSPSNPKIYEGYHVDFTINASNLNAVKLLLDNVDLTGEYEGNIYRVEDNGQNRALRIEEQDKFTISGTSQYTGVSISISPTMVYLGGSSTITLTGVSDLEDISVFISNGIKTKVINNRFSGSETTYIATIDNIEYDLTITVKAHVYVSVTATNDSSLFTAINGIGTFSNIDAGENYYLCIQPNQYYQRISILDNDIIKSNEVIYIEATSGNDELNPTGNEPMVNLTLYNSSSYPISNGYSDTSSSNYARFSVQTTAGYIEYTFDTPEIPDYAIITSVSCIARLRISNTSNVTNTTAQLYVGTTAKGSSVTFSTTSQTDITLSTGNSWTTAEAKSIKLRIGATRSADASSGDFRFYGANLTINYSVPEHYQYPLYELSTNHIISLRETKIYFKYDNTFNEYTKVYKKINGSWIEQNDYENLFDNSKIYIKN